MSLMTNIVIRSEISRYHYCHLEHLEEQIYLKIYKYHYTKETQYRKTRTGLIVNFDHVIFIRQSPCNKAIVLAVQMVQLYRIQKASDLLRLSERSECTYTGAHCIAKLQSNIYAHEVTSNR